MKNQYFGDNRDLFKYDLVLHVVQGINVIDRFTFIPMLTPDAPDNESAKREGEKRNRDKAKAGKKNKIGLIDFLDKFKDKSKRDIKQLETFFRKENIEIKIHDGKKKYFCDQPREEYFKRIGDELLSKSLVFVDPDIGLEIKSKKSSKKHIRYSEVKDLYERMDKDSILMVYQDYPRIHTQNNIKEHFLQRSEKLREITGDLPIYIDDNEIRFFFLTRDKSLKESLCKVITKYGKTYKDKGVFSNAKG